MAIKEIPATIAALRGDKQVMGHVISIPPDLYPLILNTVHNDSRYPKREFLALLRPEDVVSNPIRDGSYDDDHEERNGARAIVDCFGEGKYYGDPIDNIVCHKDQVEWVSEPQSGRNGVARMFPYPCEPHV
jgi:hypothetical protein